MLVAESNFHADWTEVQVSPIGMKMVVRLSTLALLGEERCQDDAWIELVIEFITKLRTAATELREFPSFLRRFANVFLPACRDSRATTKKIVGVILEEIEKSRQRRDTGMAENASAKGREPCTVFAWCEENLLPNPGGDDATVNTHLMLYFAAVLTSTDLLCQVILDLAVHPELIQSLRDEINGVFLSAEGWTKTSLYKMALLDSVIKETQRVKPFQVGMCVEYDRRTLSVQMTGSFSDMSVF